MAHAVDDLDIPAFMRKRDRYGADGVSNG